MIAVNTPLQTSPPGPDPNQSQTPTVRRGSMAFACFILKFRSKQKPAADNVLSVADQSTMELESSVGSGCFKNRQENGVKVEMDSGGEDVFEAGNKETPEHLVIMVNGLIGSASDWRYAAEQFVKRLPDKIIVHRSECNCSKLTFDGVDTMGERLAEEVLAVVRNWPGVRKISFVAHSLGGLVARFAIGRLFENTPRTQTSSVAENSMNEEFGDSMNHSLEKRQDGRIAGLEPMNFITVATPHLGSRGHKQLPFLCGFPFLERRASQTAHLVAGRSGKHLFLTDTVDGKAPLLLQMVNDSDDLKFMSALHAFKRRVAYANVNFDHVVGWGTSSIRRQDELPKPNLLEINEKYPHVVYVEPASIHGAHDKEDSSIIGNQKIDLEEEMIRGLNQVPWERVDVSFHKSRQRYTAHNTIQDEDEDENVIGILRFTDWFMSTKNQAVERLKSARTRPILEGHKALTPFGPIFSRLHSNASADQLFEKQKTDCSPQSQHADPFAPLAT